jgi:hypothetical protein
MQLKIRFSSGKVAQWLDGFNFCAITKIIVYYNGATSAFTVRYETANQSAPPPPPAPPPRATPSKLSTVKVPWAAIRSGPGVDYPTVGGGRLRYGTDVIVLDIVVPWVHVDAPDGAGGHLTGYVNGYELTPPH